MILALMGPPGVGKGTQAARIALHYGVPAISTGAMFREAVAQGTELGRIIQRYRIDQGEFVPDDVVIAAVSARIDAPDCKPGFLLDGFPRTIPQAEGLDRMLAEKGRFLKGVLDFVAPFEELIQRFSGRRICPVDGQTYHVVYQPPVQPGICDQHKLALITRPDDAPEVVQRRLEVYRERTAPLEEYYRARNLLYVIDANAEPETVFGRVIETVEAIRKRWKLGS